MFFLFIELKLLTSYKLTCVSGPRFGWLKMNPCTHLWWQVRYRCAHSFQHCVLVLLSPSWCLRRADSYGSSVLAERRYIFVKEWYWWTSGGGLMEVRLLLNRDQAAAAHLIILSKIKLDNIRNVALLPNWVTEALVIMMIIRELHPGIAPK